MFKVSVIIPVYNVEKYLNKCLDSILNQTLEDIEVICIDDGSSDSSLEILKEYQIKDKRLKVISQKNEGAAVSRNKGINLAKGEYISFVDSDDWLELDALEKLYNNAKSNDSDLVLFNSIEIYDDKTKNRIYLPLDELIDYNNFTFDYKYNKDLVLNKMFVIWSKFYKTSFLKENNIRFYNHEIFNDVQFHIETMIFAKKISYLPEILYNYNKLNITSIQTKKTKHNKRLVIFEIFDEIKLFFMNLDLWEEFKIDFYEFYIKESKVNLDKTSKKFKDEFYNKMRLEFLKMRLDQDILSQIPLKWYRLYIQVINCDNLNNFKSFKFYNKRYNFINKMDLIGEIENFNEYGLNTDKRDESIIISLTSFPERMHDISFSLYSLLNQNFKPDKVILWLADSQFPNKEKDIPEVVLNFKKNGLTIRWCEDIQSYKKIIPTLKEYPNSYIVTADDDIYYPKDWLRNMWEAYQQYPNTIIASRVRRIEFNYDNTFRRYNEWDFADDFSTSYCNFSTNGAGTLFFPNSLSELTTDDSLFLKLCPSCDDVWLWAMAVLNKTKITSIGNPLKHLTYVNILRENNANDEYTLWEDNKEGINDISINNMLEQFPEIMEIINQNGDIDG